MTAAENPNEQTSSRQTEAVRSICNGVKEFPIYRLPYEVIQ